MNVIALRKVERLLSATADLEQATDNRGQIVLCTGMYRWADGTVRDGPEPVGGDINLSTEEVEEEEENVESDYDAEPPTLKTPTITFLKCAVCTHEVCSSYMEAHLTLHRTEESGHHYTGPVEQSKVA
jgi:hypothetical protein